MALDVSSPASTVDFPETDGSVVLPHPRPAYLPFRRISLPTPPSVAYRHSVASMDSLDSSTEELPRSTPASPVKNVASKSRSRRTSMEPLKRSAARLRPIDETREAKRRKIIMEFYDTERSYVDGLELIYSHFLTPIMATLETPYPLLTASELTAAFSNFIDIWNLHRRFFHALSTLLLPTSASPTAQPPALSPVLLAHFPYLSLYNPFVTAFPGALASLNAFLANKPAFAAFVMKQEEDPRCGKLKLRDWLLTIVQRCPRYLLLLKDLVNCTDPVDPEHASLTAAHTLVSKITSSLNTSLHTHAKTLALLALQRSTPNLPFQLIAPGRTFLRRGPLLQLEGASAPKDREFLLFSDCLIWLSSSDRGDGEVRWGESEEGTVPTPTTSGDHLALPARPPMTRKRSKSDAELPTTRSETLSDLSESAPPSAFLEGERNRIAGRQSKSNLSALIIPKPKKRKMRVASSGVEERWIYRGHAQLVDVEVVLPHVHDPGDERRFDILSPERSFAVYADSETERDEWTAAIRNAKAALLMALNAMHPNSTLTSSASNAHIRRALQAIPYSPEEEASGKKPRRGKVEHFVPAIWVPDAKTEACMRCGRPFGWRRRRHHCRLCGRCVCAACSDQTFYVADSSESGAKNKPARACNACYETVFPVIEVEPTQSASAMLPSGTVSTLSNFPTWQSISTPALAIPNAASKHASALLAIDLDSPSRPALSAAQAGDDDDVFAPPEVDWNMGAGTPPSPSRVPRMRKRQSMQRPKSYVQILEEFSEEAQISSREGSRLQDDDRHGKPTSPTMTRTTSALSAQTVATSALSLETDPTEEEASSSGSPRPMRKEDTARRHKRFSMPAMALQTTSVMVKPTTTGEGKSKRFSLVLGRSGGSTRKAAKAKGTAEEDEEGRRSKGLANGAAATKLNELLGRKKQQ
ncbi:hypothetical protein PUNSTDRAFT_96046 [Punctularia strigosozonata HHB-11173 SS5]|uniref:uncharacterized protein n=1 Tax=Punctularia strigosozonata (strain HHB-11173) TaxID=741275 RepID=UPI000441686B|nr:uncharacterized protein PUNSTDRAFT_96046 [Punctularia strigosozonata HHB-11173 SS5]EIN14293.1 hypothetical protein PUNSTDRAFT_96046 [Punctularia strigosozonata HHB-11173 SS5]